MLGLPKAREEVSSHFGRGRHLVEAIHRHSAESRKLLHRDPFLWHCICAGASWGAQAGVLEKLNPGEGRRCPAFVDCTALGAKLAILAMTVLPLTVLDRRRPV